MGLKDLLVHVDGSAASDARLDVAVALARIHQAHLTGLFVIPPIFVSPFYRDRIPKRVFEDQAQSYRDAAATAAESFRQRAEGAEFTSEWRSVPGPVSETVCQHARYCDLAVIGQHDPDSLAEIEDMPDHVILTLGRPVLLVPYVGEYATMGDRVLVAWDGSRLAARAVNDALPILRNATRVTVMVVRGSGETGDEGEVPGADICQHLARHGVQAEANFVIAEDIDTGSMLLGRTADTGADLLVMGAYGHARWRELVLGGVTRHMLNHMTLPVFMSH